MSTGHADRKNLLASIAAEFNKQHGAGTVLLGKDVKSTTLPRMTSGFLALDAILGGGWPANQWNEILGVESSGKTTTVLKTVAANQALDPEWTAVWIAAEHFNIDWAETLGVDMDRLILIEDNLMEVGYEAAIRYAESRAVDCVVVDSLPAMVPGDENEKAMEDAGVSVGARLTNKFFRKVGKAMRRSLVEDDPPVLGIIINQWRDQVGGWSPRGTPQTSPGGKGKNYAFYTRVEVRRGDWMKEGKDHKVGHEIKFYTSKNKSSAPYKTAVVDFYFAPSKNGFGPGEDDLAKQAFSVGSLYGVIENPAQGSYVIGGAKVRGQEKASQMLRDDPALLESVVSDIRAEMSRKESNPMPQEDNEDE